MSDFENFKLHFGVLELTYYVATALGCEVAYCSAVHYTVGNA